MTIIDPYHRRINITRIIDGDTIEVVVDLGFRTHGIHRVRLLGVDAPEKFSGDQTTREAGKAAHAWVSQWLLDHNHKPETWPYIMRSEKADSFGRYLGWITCSQDHVLNEDIIASGHAIPYT